jgi:hypothetical protein
VALRYFNVAVNTNLQVLTTSMVIIVVSLTIGQRLLVMATLT